MRVERCDFSGYRIYPSKGKTYVRGDSKVGFGVIFELPGRGRTDIGLDRRAVRACGRRLGLDGMGIELDGMKGRHTIGNGGNGDHQQEGH